APAHPRGGGSPGGHSSAALRVTQGNHGGQEDGDRQRRAGRHRAGAGARGRRGSADRSPLGRLPGGGGWRPDLRRRSGDGGAGTGRQAAVGSEGVLMAGVWVVLQHRDGKFHRMSREAVAAAQRLAARSGAKATAVLLGSGVDGLAAEAAGWDLEAVRVADAPVLAGYTPGAWTAALLPALAAAQPEFVLFPHTYQSCEF